jgi:hypothetical protein
MNSVGMSHLQQPLVEASVSPSDIVISMPSKKGTSGAIKTLIGVALALLVVNGVLIHQLVQQYNEAAPVIKDANKVFAAAKDVNYHISVLTYRCRFDHNAMATHSCLTALSYHMIS